MTPISFLSGGDYVGTAIAIRLESNISSLDFEIWCLEGSFRDAFMFSLIAKIIWLYHILVKRIA
jgi:hypothetical protein